MSKLNRFRRKDGIKPFQWKPLSIKQQKVMTWWNPICTSSRNDIIIADGAIRSGKTVSMVFSYITWAMTMFDRQNFAICGKTIASLKRNVIEELKKMCVGNYLLEEIRNENLIILAYYRDNKLIINNFYCFGGKDESSQDLIQGITLAGCLFDEVALMPRSFVNQATARCSVQHSKLWFNCNPNSPQHYFKTDWIDKREDKKIYYLHFTMEDNLTLSEEIKERYRSMYTGVFYDRYINGLWVLAEGIIYDSFNANSMIFDKLDVRIVKSWIGLDYGTSNATTFILLGLGEDNKLYILDEYYHSGREGIKKSPEQYESELVKWIEKVRMMYRVKPEYIYIDPAANYFITQLWYSKEIDIKIRQANNSVIDGIQLVQSFITTDSLRVNKQCTNILNEFGSYRWDDKAQARGDDKPVKTDDHCLDALRYVIYSNKMFMLRLLDMRR